MFPHKAFSALLPRLGKTHPTGPPAPILSLSLAAFFPGALKAGPV